MSTNAAPKPVAQNLVAQRVAFAIMVVFLLLAPLVI